MDKNIRAGINFGIISGILTATGIIVGLISTGATKEVLAAAVLIVAFADAFSDSLSLHLSLSKDEGAANHWQSLALAFFTKLIISSTFLLPILLSSDSVTMVLSIIWSTLLLTVLGYYLAAGAGKKKIAFLAAKHLMILAAVCVISYYIGAIFKGFNLH